LEAENNFKVNATLFEGIIGKEFFIRDSLNLFTGVEFLNIRADFNDALGNQFFISNNHINSPLSLQFETNQGEVISFFGSMGVYGSYLYSSIVENIASGVQVKESGLGFNFGAHVNLASKLQLMSSSIFV
jgi:hypothetical protein